MKINLMTDAPKPNLALMKLSAYHKAQGDDVYLNMPLIGADYTYASILFEKTLLPDADEYGGPAFPEVCLPPEVDQMKPDYSLYPNIKHSLGYTFRPCYRGCSFCKVKDMNHPDSEHHSIWDFHDERFSTIELLNNNTFFDLQWEDTFGEIWEAGLSVLDHGFDLRLLDDRKTAALKQTKWVGNLHFAFDQMDDAKAIMRGLELLREHKISGSRVYVLIGNGTTVEEDIWRCQVIKEYGQTPYIMPYIQDAYHKSFKRFVDSFMWRKYTLFSQALRNYKGACGEYNNRTHGTLTRP